MDSKALTGTVTLTNTIEYPFNNSTQTVALEKLLKDQEYTVLTEVVSTQGDVGDIVISGKAINGFKLAFTGAARQAVISYRVIGGGV